MTTRPTQNDERHAKHSLVADEKQLPRLPLSSEHGVDDNSDEYSFTSTSISPVLTTGDDDRSSTVQQIASSENAHVNNARILVLAVLVLSATIVGFLTFHYVSTEEDDDFIAQFRTDAKELMDKSNVNGWDTLEVLAIFAYFLSANARRSGGPQGEWPRHTLGDFEEFGSASRSLNGALLLAFSPLVTNATRAEWEEYSVANQGWIGEGLGSLGQTDVVPHNITPYIYRETSMPGEYLPEFDNELHSPVWQISPAPSDTSVVNYNLFNHPTFQRLVEFVAHTRLPAISEVLDTSLAFGTSASQKGDHPQSIAVSPIFRIPQRSSSDIVGHVVAVISWAPFFQGILQEGHNGVYAVLEDTCGNSFTYVDHGKNAVFLGEGDLHERDYDSLGESTDFVAYNGNLTGISGLHCHYTMTVYPSSEYEEDYRTQDPIFFTVAVIFVFTFTSAVFALYDYCVSRRQHKVNSVAVKSNAIVTSLFPEQVRDKLFQDHEKELVGGASKSKLQFKVRSAAAVDSFDVVPSRNGDDDIQDEMGKFWDSPPIADLFPSATVLFMDIAGFTTWSSQREPSQVFILLETIYCSFDKMAKQRGVFKVETIGYVSNDHGMLFSNDF